MQHCHEGVNALVRAMGRMKEDAALAVEDILPELAIRQASVLSPVFGSVLRLRGVLPTLSSGASPAWSSTN
jgi:hypothetical protein